jgi:hypothetical protein
MIDDLWKRSHSVLLDGIHTNLLCPEDLLIHTCIHTSIDHGLNNGIKPFIDIACILEHYENTMDWNQLMTIIRELHVTNCIYLMLNSTKKLLGATILEHILYVLQPTDKSL